LAVDKAKANNMPKDNIDRAIRRGTGEDKDGAAFEQIMYEGYGPHGVAFIIEVVTDNRNRTVAELRHALTKGGGNMADAGAVYWQFKRTAYFYIPSEKADGDRVFEIAVDAGADDVVLDEDEYEIFAPVELFKSVSDALNAAGIKPEESSLRMLPNTPLTLSGDQTIKIMNLIEDLEELDDVQEVFSNLDVTDEALSLLETA
jgi:YebC/PmpR family DNA-binding regulatory protein